MIQINCTNCKALLQIDDAFAGGVCRCRYCGTIQTVPKHLKNPGGNGESTVAAVEQAAAAKSAKALYKKAAIDSTGSGTGLDDLASIVASSGLSSGRLQKKSGANAAASAKPSPANDRRLLIIVASAGGVIALLLGIIIFMALRDKTGGANTGNNGNENQNNSTPVRNDNPNPTAANNNTSSSNVAQPTIPPRKRIPNFLGHPLTESSVAYVIDRGQSANTEARLDLLKPALVNSVRSLGPNRKFQVILWQVQGQTTPIFPKDGMGPANDQNIAGLIKFLEDVVPFGQTKGPHAIEKAYKLNPQAIVLVPIKGVLRDEEEDFAIAMMKPRGASTAKVYSFTLAQTALSTPLRQIANQTNGAYHDVSLDDLRNAGYEQ
jgi:hypothetical protein